MKTKVLILMIALSGLFACGCNSDDDATSQDPIEGTWNLQNVYGGLITVDIDYDLGEVHWTFDTTSGTVVIENNILTTGPEDIYAGLDSGTYNYEIVFEGTNQAIYVDNQRMGILIMGTNTLSIDNGLSSDGFISKYVR